MLLYDEEGMEMSDEEEVKEEVPVTQRSDKEEVKYES